MKKVVSFFAVAAALLIAGSAQAQLGINVGYAPETTTSVLTIGNTSTKSTDVMNGFFAGVNYNINVSGDLNISVGLQARYNTNSSEDKVGTVTTKINRTKIMADIPLLFNYGIRVGNDARLSVFLGPTVSYALQGKITTTVSESITGANTVKSSSMYGENSNNSPLDIMGTAGLSFNFKGFRLYAGYRMGFMDLNKSNNVKTTAAGWFAGAGFVL